MSILDLFYPKSCAGCRKIGTYFCPNCIANTRLHFPQVCPVCERPSLDGLSHTGCRASISPEGLTSVWNFEGAPRKLITKLKYKFVEEVALSLASSAAGVLKNIPRTKPGSPNWTREKFTLVPVPLHWTRKNWRGFNHVEEIAKILAGLMGWDVVPLLTRPKKTRPQVGLKEDERKKNVEGIFEINPHSRFTIPDSVLLFDDVWTTGATIREATKTLKEAGCKRVWCLTLAR